MVWSNDQQFEVILFNPKLGSKSNVYREMTTPEGLYIIASPDDEFQILVNSEDPQGNYSIEVIIDGFKLPQPKPLKKSARIHGFKEGPGYRAFKFQRPPHDTLGSNQFTKPQLGDKKYLDNNTTHENDKTNYIGGPGEIIVKIYKTKEVPRKPGGGGEPRTPREHNDPVFIPFTYNENKKSIEQSLGIAMGELYVTTGGVQGNTSRPPRGEGGTGVSYKGIFEEEGILASFRLFYTDVYSMIEKRYLNLDFPQHLTLIPLSFYKNNERQIIRILQTIVRGGRASNQNGAKLNEIIARCEHWIKYPLSQIIGNGAEIQKLEDEFIQANEVLLKEFFKSHSEYFIEDMENGVFKVKNAISKRINTYQVEEGEI